MSNRFLASLTALLVSAAALAYGCSQNKPQAPAPPPTATVDLVRGGQDVPAAIASWVEANKQSFGGYARKEGDRVFLMAAMGQRPTGGFEVRIDEVLRGKEGLVAIATLSAPKAGQAVTQALTYPYDLVSITASEERASFAFRGAVAVQPANPAAPAAPQPAGPNPAGAKPAPGESQPGPKPTPLASSGRFRIYQPAPSATITSPLRISGQASVADGNFLIRLEDGRGALAEKWVRVKAKAPAWEDFEIEIAYQQASTPTGVFIFLDRNPQDLTVREDLRLEVKFGGSP